MLTKDQFISSLRHEYNVIRHIFANLPQGCDDWRPSPEQRSVLELLQYLSCVGSMTTIFLVKETRDHFAVMIEASKKVNRDSFLRELERDEQQTVAMIEGVSNEELQTRDVELPYARQKLGMAFVSMTLKFLSAYKLQLFTYAKACGANHLGTADAWAGISRDQLMANTGAK